MTTSDSIDRVFSHALATVRRLPRTGSSRPPPEARLRLYGLYKQSMEGDVDAILPRPTLPPPSPQQASYPGGAGGGAADDAHDQTSTTTTTPTTTIAAQQDAGKGMGNALTRYGSRQLRTREAQAEIEKWDAWHACKGMSQTAAKKAYIRTLIETMKEYASGTQESRELVGELEFVWRQISRRRGSGDEDDDDDDDHDHDDDDEGYQDTEADSPRRSGLVRLGQREARGGGGGGGGGGGNNSGKMTLLSPVGQSDGGDEDGSVVANEEVVDGDEEEEEEAEEAEEDRSSASAATSSPSPKGRTASRSQHAPQQNSSSSGTGQDRWRHSVEAHLRHLSTEIAALREQLSSHQLLAPSAYSPSLYQRQQQQHRRLSSLRWRLWYGAAAWLRWAVGAAVRQALVQLCLLALALVHGRWTGDRRLEAALRQRLNAALARARNWHWHWDTRWLKKLPFG